MKPKTFLMKLSHRRMRDVRVTPHLMLTARAFGASGMYFGGDRDESLFNTLRKVSENWGGNFRLEHVDDAEKFVGNWKARKGEVVHLTMYGLPIQYVIGEIRASKKPKLVVVGGEKVPSWIFNSADWNVAVTAQPHSEISAATVFLHMLYEGKELGLGSFSGAKLTIVPSARGKKVLKISPNKG